MKKTIVALLLSLFFISVNQLRADNSVTIGIVLDGPIKRDLLSLNQIKKETIDLMAGEFDITFPEDKVIHGNWNVEGIQTALQTLLNDSEVDIIITNGLVSSHQAAQIENLKKPIVSPIVADRVLQNLPYSNGSSGKSNYVYISDNRTVEEDLRQFYQLIQFKHLGIIVDKLFLDALPELRGATYNIQKELGFEITILPVVDNPENALTDLPPGIDAMYIPPLLRFTEEDFKNFSEQLIILKLPSFSLMGREELEMGILATLSGRNIDTIRYARRIALYVQSILIGTDAANLKVDLDQPPKLAINMRTARAIGYSPKWQILEVSDVLYKDETVSARSIALVEAIQTAVDSNLSLQIDKLDLALAEDDVSRARSPLLPQISLGAGANQIDRDRAGLSQAERSVDTDITASQLVYSESSRSGYEVAKSLRQAQDASLRSSILDVMSSSATAYIQLLQAKATEQVRQSNLNVTETNLELAETRLKIGYSDRSDVLRWESQLATDRRNLYIAQSQRDQSETALKRLLHIPLTEGISVTDQGISDLLSILDNDRFKRFFDNPFSFEIFTLFEVERALENSPELEQIEHIISSNQRQLLAAERAYYVPDVNVNAQYGQNIERGGIGEDSPNINNNEWSIGLNATLPLFAGGARKAEVSRANNALVQSQYQLHEIKEQIEARVITSLQKAKGSYPAIRLSKDASDAAEENLSLVIDAYSKGVVSITDLIDAQDAALAASLSAVEAQYAFMIDWIEIQRAVANFDLLLTTDGINNWYQALDSYYSLRDQ